MANLANGLGMRVIATNATIPDNAPAFIEHIGLPNELGGMIGQADVVMLALPLTPDTTHLFNAAMFAKMKRGVIFVNEARDEEEVDSDLIAALQSGQVSAAGLDDPSPDNPMIGVKKCAVDAPCRRPECGCGAGPGRRDHLGRGTRSSAPLCQWRQDAVGDRSGQGSPALHLPAGGAGSNSSPCLAELLRQDDYLRTA